jgi:hypothetical protein
MTFTKPGPLLAATIATIGIASTTALPAYASSHHHKHHHTRATIPQHNGGDRDSDNNGGPSDGDGNA